MTKIFVPVSVKDELPEIGKTVPVILNDGRVCQDRGGVSKLNVGFWRIYEDRLVTHWLKEVDANDIRQKIRSVLLCMSAHPDNEPHSEFRDRIEDLERILNILTPNNNEQEK